MKNPAEIIIILDKSGSMYSIKEPTIDSFNEFISEQKAEIPEALISLVQFNQNYYVTFSGEKVDKVKPLTAQTYVPEGMTALLDAIGKTIKKTRKRHKKTAKKNRPETVTVAIITDGMENSSTKYTRKKIFEKITKLEKKHDWNFVFLGANQDAIKEAAHFGIKEKKAMTFAADHLGIYGAIKAFSKNTSDYILYKKEFEFSREQRREQERRKK